MGRRWHRFCVGVILLMAWLSGALLLSGTAHAAADTRPVLKVAYAEFPPIEYRNDKGEAAGLFIDLTRKVAAEAGFTLEFVYLPVGRIYLYLQNGTVDLWPGLTGIPSLRDDVLESWASPLPVQLSAWYVEGTPPLAQFKDLEGRRPIVIGGYTYGGLLNKLQAAKNVEITEAPNHRAGIDMLKRNRGDYLLDYRQPVMEILRQPSDRMLRQSEVRTRNTAWLFSLVNHDASDLREAFDDAYLRLAERGEIPPVRKLSTGFVLPGFPEDLPP